MNHAEIKLIIFFWCYCYWASSETYTSTKIIGGRRARLGEFPSTIRMTGGRLLRGGTLATVDMVITAAHCLYIYEKRVNPVDIIVMAGIVDIYDYTDNLQTSTLRDYLVQDKFRNETLSVGKYPVNDIAVMFLETPFIETKTLKPAIFPSYREAGMKSYMEKMVNSTTICHATGFGLISVKPRVRSRFLKVADIEVSSESVVPVSDLLELELWVYTNATTNITTFGDSGSTFLCEGKTVGLVKGIGNMATANRSVIVLIFTLFGPYMQDFIFAGNNAMPNFQIHPPVLVFLLFTVFFSVETKQSSSLKK